jgi:2'-5' RNA ligase
MRVKLVEPENLHISLSFLGEVQEDEVPTICAGLDVACNGFSKFTAKITKVSLIPNEKYLRVIAADVESMNGVLEKLRLKIHSDLGGSSHPSHITLGRVREVTNKSFVAEHLKGVSFNSFFEVKSVCLIKSVNARSGPAYQIVHESELV